MDKAYTLEDNGDLMAELKSMRRMVRWSTMLLITYWMMRKLSKHSRLMKGETDYKSLIPCNYKPLPTTEEEQKEVA